MTAPRLRPSALLPTIAAVVPLVVAAARAATTDWAPILDNAYFTARSLDVGTEHHPLVGAWSSGSTQVDELVNNPGPLQLDLLAPFTRVDALGGTAVGTAAVHVAAIVTVAWLVARLAGTRAVLPAMVGVSTLTWTMGSEMLITPQQHQYLILPYVAVLTAAWAAGAGDRWALVPLVFFGSLTTQTHLTYVVLVGMVAVPALVGQVAAARRHGRARFVRPWITAAVLGVALWAQSVLDQFVGFGNLADLAGSSGDSPSPGVGTGLRLASGLFVSTRWFLRPGFADFDAETHRGDLGHVIVFAAVVAVAAAGAWLALLARHRVAASGLAVASTAMVASVLDAGLIPLTEFGFQTTNYRWLWAGNAFVLIGALMAAERLFRRREALATGALAVLLVVLVAANVPRSVQASTADSWDDRVALAHELDRQLRSVELDGPVFLDESNLGFGLPFVYPIATVLNDRDIEFRLAGPVQERRFGEGRVADGTEPATLVILFGTLAADARDDPTTVVYVESDPDPLALVLLPGG